MFWLFTWHKGIWLTSTHSLFAHLLTLLSSFLARVQCASSRSWHGSSTLCTTCSSVDLNPFAYCTPLTPCFLLSLRVCTVRFITELAWQQHFVRNMFIRPKSDAEIEDFVPDFTIINACKVTNPDYKAEGLNSDVFVSFNVEKNVGIIGGTWYVCFSCFWVSHVSMIARAWHTCLTR